MLILVAITIRIAIGGGLFGHAKNASDKTKEAIAQEKNLSIEDLVSQYTRDDLERLKKYLVGKGIAELIDMDLYLSSNESIIKLLDDPETSEDESQAIEVYLEIGAPLVIYHSHYYFVSFDENEKVDDVIALSEKDEFCIIVAIAELNGEAESVTENGKNIILYNNKKYKAITSEDSFFGTEIVELSEKEYFYLEMLSAIDNDETQDIQVNGTWFIKYNNKLYKEIESEDSIFEHEFVEASTDEYEQYQYVLVSSNGTQMLSNPFVFYEYNNNVYELSNNRAKLVGVKNEIAIFVSSYYDGTEHKDYIVIRPTTNQTWTNWANTTSDRDLVLYVINDDTYTLLQKIRANNGMSIENLTTNTKIDDLNTAISTGCIYKEWVIVVA